jgi:hypothetical protein
VERTSVRKHRRGHGPRKPSRKKPGTVLFSLNHVIDFEWMREAYVRTRKDGAMGIAGATAQDYEANREANLMGLLERIKSGRYKAPPVRRTYVPKVDGSQRPIGIPHNAPQTVCVGNDGRWPLGAVPPDGVGTAGIEGTADQTWF